MSENILKKIIDNKLLKINELKKNINIESLKITIDENYEPKFQYFPMPMASDGLRIRLDKI